MWGPMLRKRRQGSLEDADWPGGTSLPPAPAKDDRITRFKQQTLSSYTVTFSPRLVIGFYFAVALLFIPFGASVIAGSAGIRGTAQISYGTEQGWCERPSLKHDNACIVKVNVEQDIPEPSYLFYVIDNMHQNLREYVKSRSDVQLRGQTPTSVDDVKDCFPMLYKEPYTNRSETFLYENPLNTSEILNPCGLTAASRFNDTLYLYRNPDAASEVPVSNKGIAWSTDKGIKFRPGKPPHFKDEVNNLTMSEEFLVWMRLSAFSRVEKLYGIINEPLKKGTYYMHIKSQYPVASFGGRKHFFISSTKWFGARNHFLGVLYTTVGVLALVVALVVLGAHVVYPRPRADFDPDRIKTELAKLSFGQMD